MLTAIAVMLGLAGCGLLPGGTSTGPAVGPPGSAGPPASGANALPTPRGAPERVSAGARSPAAAVRSFVATYINWTSTDVALRLAGLARDSVGQARSELELEAQATRHDGELHAGGVRNSGVVEAVAPVPGRRLQYIVVTREQTTASRSRDYAGLRAAWHVSLATVAQVPAGRGGRSRRWAVSRWQPES